jgi:hypothetical protein
MHTTDTGFKTEFDSDVIIFDEIVVSNPETSGSTDGHRRLAGVGKALLAAGGAIALLASASLVQQTTSEPGPTPVPAAISPSDAILGYLLSDQVPNVRIGPPVIPTPSSADLTLGYLLSDDFPDLTPGRDRTQDPLALLFSEDYPDIGR